MNSTHVTGAISEIRAGAILLEAGFNVLQPIGNYLRYDLVIEREGEFARLQVKTGVYRKGVITFRNESIYTYKNKKIISSYTSDEIDKYAVYCRELDKLYLVPVGVAQSRETTLRVIAPTNNQSKNIRWAAHYEINLRVA